MSKCEQHNDHSHILLWICLFWTVCGMFNSCNFGLQSVERDVSALQRDHDDLKREVDRLRSEQRR